MIGQRSEKADTFLLALRREIAANAPACVCDTGASGLWQRRKLHCAAVHQCAFPRQIVQIEATWFGRLIDAVHLRAVFHRQTARFILIFDAVPARQPRPGDLIVQRDGGVRQIVKQGFQFFVKERQPVFRALMFAPGADGLIKRIVGACRAKFQPVALAKTGNGSLVQNNL